MTQTTTQNSRQSPTIIAPTLKYCLYARKSSEAEDRQALSIESQIKEMTVLAEREGLEVAELKREAHSSKDVGQRPVFNEMIAELRAGKYNAILTWAPDRLSRNAGDLGSVVDLMDQKLLVEIRTYSQRFTNNPNEKFLLMILGSQAKLENDNKAVNVKRGLRTRLEMGLWPGVAPTGYLSQHRTDRKGQVIVDPERSRVIRQMFEKVAQEQYSGRRVYQWLRHDIGFKTKNGNYLSLSNIFLILKNTFYYGMMEYPRGSGNWYQGQHTPLIDKELFDKVQEQISRDKIIRQTNKEFAFTRLIACGLCGSGITAEEKFKNLADGSVRRYVYYGCTRSRDLHCKNGYMQEDMLAEQMLKLIDDIKLEEIGIRDKLEREVKRYQKFQGIISQYGANQNAKVVETSQANIKTYAKYILMEGNIIDKRELLGSLKSRLVLTNRVLTLQE